MLSPPSDQPDDGALPPCEAEPIRTPGAIQAHGRMAVLDRRTLEVLAASDNWPAAEPPDRLLAGHDAALRAADDFTEPQPIDEIRLDGRQWLIQAHRSGERLIVEFEPLRGDEPVQVRWTQCVLDMSRRLQRCAKPIDAWQLATDTLRAWTGAGRALLYRFDEDGHGEVLAETLGEGHAGYLGHFFPAGDIPPQARALYLENRFRVIPDAWSAPVPLVGRDPGLSPTAIDLSQAALRGVSPIHLEFMRNMGTAMSMSVSIVVDGRLWGLVSCHDHHPRHLGHECRLACEQLGRHLSLFIEAHQRGVDTTRQLEGRRLVVELIAGRAVPDESLAWLIDDARQLLALVEADGVALWWHDQCHRSGSCPAPEVIGLLVDQALASGEKIWHSDRFSAGLPAGSPTGASAGVLAAIISRGERHVLLWFRDEDRRTILWAGAPPDQPPDDQGRPHPHRNFAAHREQRRGRSRPWSDDDVDLARVLKRALIDVALIHAQRQMHSAERLAQTNRELEAFTYTVSHDLRAPLRHISSYIGLALEASASLLDEHSLRYLNHARDAATHSGEVVDALLHFSRLGRASLDPVLIDGKVLVEQMLVELIQDQRLPTAPGPAIDWHVDAALPSLKADRVLIQVVLRNLLDNAVKYSARTGSPAIRIEGIEEGGATGLVIRDNGVGFDMRYAHKLFSVFQRLHPEDAFEGTGIGLAMVKRIVERHGGRVWAEGAVDQGASFGFLLPLGPVDPPRGRPKSGDA